MFEITNTTKQRPYSPEADFVAIKNAILGKTYDLSLAFVGERRAQALNTEHRHKTYVPNVLSFPLDESSGEIFITPTRVRREAASFEMTPAQYERYLFIHACVHLTGLDHGDEMTKLETRYCKRFLK